MVAGKKKVAPRTRYFFRTPFWTRCLSSWGYYAVPIRVCGTEKYIASRTGLQREYANYDSCLLYQAYAHLGIQIFCNSERKLFENNLKSLKTVQYNECLCTVSTCRLSWVILFFQINPWHIQQLTMIVLIVNPEKADNFRIETRLFSKTHSSSHHLRLSGMHYKNLFWYCIWNPVSNWSFRHVFSSNLSKVIEFCTWNFYLNLYKHFPSFGCLNYI